MFGGCVGDNGTIFITSLASYNQPVRIYFNGRSDGVIAFGEQDNLRDISCWQIAYAVNQLLQPVGIIATARGKGGNQATRWKCGSTTPVAYCGEVGDAVTNRIFVIGQFIVFINLHPARSYLGLRIENKYEKGDNDLK